MNLGGAKIDKKELSHLLNEFKAGKITSEAVEDILSLFPYEDIVHTKVDHHRSLRKGFPEVFFGKGKSPNQILDIIKALSATTNTILVTKASYEVFKKIEPYFKEANFDEMAKTITINKDPINTPLKGLAIVTAGTSDMPVAKEALITAQIMGLDPETHFDVGVAGIHRLLSTLPKIRTAKVIIVVAGMEGALASVVGGLVDVPVIAVPTSTGYGSSFDGLAALLSMLNSCAPGMSVVNIDNGFGAGYLAAMIMKAF